MGKKMLVIPDWECGSEEEQNEIIDFLDDRVIYEIWETE